MSREIRQEVQFDASPEAVMRAIIDPEQFSRATGSPADIAGQEGDVFSCFGGAIHGRHIELKAGRRIVQAWRARNWPEGKYSIVTFEFTPEERGTRMRFLQAGHPDGEEDHLSAGWHKMYWDPIRLDLAKLSSVT